MKAEQEQPDILLWVGRESTVSCTASVWCQGKEGLLSAALIYFSNRCSSYKWTLGAGRARLNTSVCWTLFWGSRWTNDWKDSVRKSQATFYLHGEVLEHGGGALWVTMSSRQSKMLVCYLQCCCCTGIPHCGRILNFCLSSLCV